MSPLLSICIPTYNRLRYLEDLLQGLLPQSERVAGVEVCVSDNRSTDGTADYLAGLSSAVLRHWTNERNIGGDRNFLKCIREARGEYVWLVGDDDLVPEGAVEKVLSILRERNASLLVSDDEIGDVQFASYGEFLSKNCRRSGSVALRHALISANVFRRRCFDLEFAEKMLYTQYAHMFGLVKGLSGPVMFTSGLVAVRPVLAEFAKYPSCLCVKQALYMCYLAKHFGLPRFRLYAMLNACNLAAEYASRGWRWLRQR